MPKHQQKSSLQGAGKKLLKSATTAANTPGKIVKAKKQEAVVTKKSRQELDAHVAALRDRHNAKNFKRQPPAKVILAAPIFDLPSQRELLLRPQIHPMDALLEGERSERVAGPRDNAGEGAVYSTMGVNDGGANTSNRFAVLEAHGAAAEKAAFPSPLRVILQPSILSINPLPLNPSFAADDDYDDL